METVLGHAKVPHRPHQARRLKSAGLLLLILAGCQSASTTAPSIAPPSDTTKPVYSPTSPRICHIVVCWLRDPGNPEARQRLIDASKTFRQIPGVLDVRCGSVLPSATTRAAVDSTYDIAVVITFDSVESLKAYQTNPLHVKATRETLMPLTGRLAIYDFQEQ